MSEDELDAEIERGRALLRAAADERDRIGRDGDLLCVAIAVCVAIAAAGAVIGGLAMLMSLATGAM